MVKEENSFRKQSFRKAEQFGERFMSILMSIAVIALSAFYHSMNLILFSKIAAIVAVIILAVSAVKVLGWQKSIPQWQPSAAILAVTAAVILNTVIVFLNPVNDLWYYLGDTVCILILVAASAIMLNVYNIGTTRPLPRLFDREEVR